MIKMYILNRFGFLVAMLVMVSCGGGDDDPSPSVDLPSSATLMSPLQ